MNGKCTAYNRSEKGAMNQQGLKLHRKDTFFSRKLRNGEQILFRLISTIFYYFSTLDGRDYLTRAFFLNDITLIKFH